MSEERASVSERGRWSSRRSSTAWAHPAAGSPVRLTAHPRAVAGPHPCTGARMSGRARNGARSGRPAPSKCAHPGRVWLVMLGRIYHDHLPSRHNPASR
jgi:hypothetical protein